MSLRSTLQYDLHRFREHLGFAWYMRPQEYDVTYTVTVTNTADKEQTIRLLLPIPLEAEYQELQNEIMFTEPPARLFRDEKFGNQYAMWAWSLPPHLPRDVALQCTLRVLPRVPSYAEAAQMTDYHLKKSEEFQIFLQSDRYCDSRAPEVQRLVHEVARGETDVRTVAMMIYEYVRDRLTYGNPIDGLYTVQDAFAKDAVDCGGFDSLLCALYRGRGIPARIVSGFWAGYPKNSMHAWCEFAVPHGGWIPVDPSIGKLRKEGRTQKSGKFGMVGSDRIALSAGSDIEVRLDEEQTFRVPILQNPVCIADRGEGSTEVTWEFHTQRHA